MSRWILALVCGAAGTGCIGQLSLAPHLNRESDLAPAAAAGRYGTVLERAAAFEKQNEASKDVHWYRVWRAVAMVGLGQHAQAVTLLDTVLADVSAARVTPAQPERLRMFIYDLKASALRAQGQLPAAVGLLDQALSIAGRVELESDGDCDRDAMLAGRHQQIEDFAQQAGMVPRAARAQADAATHFAAWAKCKRLEDYPALSSLSSLVDAQKRQGVAPVIPKTNAQRPPPVALPPAAAPAAPAAAPAVAPPAPAPAKGPAERPEQLGLARTSYAPVAAKPWQSGLQAIEPLLSKRAPKAQTGMLISTDGRHHALRVTLARSASKLRDLLPVFRTSVVFFERTRAVRPTASHVVVVSGKISVLAPKSAVMDLFLEKIDGPTFLSRLSRLP